MKYFFLFYILNCINYDVFLFLYNGLYNLKYKSLYFEFYNSKYKNKKIQNTKIKNMSNIVQFEIHFFILHFDFIIWNVCLKSKLMKSGEGVV